MKKPNKKTSNLVGTCKSCGMRRVLGRCSFKGGGVDKMNHCRRCCDSPVVLRWAPQQARAARALKTA